MSTRSTRSGGAWSSPAAWPTNRRRPRSGFEACSESAPDATIVCDPQGRIILVNAQFEQLFGYAREEMVGRPIEMLIPERFRADHVGHRSAFQRAPQFRPMGSGGDLTGRRKDGTEFPVEVSLSPVDTDDGMLVSAAIRDSSARRQREAELVEARADAEAATRRIQTLIEATPLAIVELDRNECVQSWNRAAEKMFGWRAEEVIGRKLPTIPEDRRGELALLLEASAAAAPLQGFETRRRRKDGSLIDVSVWNAPRRDAGGAIDGMIGIAADITEQKRIEEHLRQSQRLKAVGQLTGGIAHEFNNLLQTILGNLDLLADRLYGQRDAAEILERVIRAGTRGAELTHQLLAFSRKQPLRPEPFSPKDELPRTGEFWCAPPSAPNTRSASMSRPRFRAPSPTRPSSTMPSSISSSTHATPCRTAAPSPSGRRT